MVVAPSEVGNPPRLPPCQSPSWWRLRWLVRQRATWQACWQMKLRQCSWRGRRLRLRSTGSPLRTQWEPASLRSSNAPHHRPCWDRTRRGKERPLRGVPRLLRRHGRQVRVAAADRARPTVARRARRWRRAWRGRRGPPSHPSRGLRARVRQRWPPSRRGRRRRPMRAARRRSCWSSWWRCRARSRRHGPRRAASPSWTRPASTRTTRTTTTSRRQIWTRRRRMRTRRAAAARGPTAI